MHYLPHRFTGAFIAALIILFSAGCSGGDDPTGPGDPEPTITILGVEDGGTYEESVTVSFEVENAESFSATLDDATFISGSTVSELGEHTLRVTARNGLEEASETVTFTITPPDIGGSSVLIVRLFDLGDNDAGGGGDAILLTDSSAAGMAHAVIDAGPQGPGGDNVGFVRNRLASLGVDTLSFLQLTHAHSDHYRGMPPILQDIHIETFYYNGQALSFFEYQDVIQQARERADTAIVPTVVERADLGGGELRTEVRVIPPLPTYLDDANASSSEVNEGSLGTEVRRGTFRMFLTGDGEREANDRWRTAFAELSGNLDILKVGHHGANDAIFDSGFSGASNWLGHTDPQVSVISANGETHPRQNALTKLFDETNLRTFCTNVHGRITIRVGPEGEYHTSVERNRGMDCVAGSEATT